MPARVLAALRSRPGPRRARFLAAALVAACAVQGPGVAGAAGARVDILTVQTSAAARQVTVLAEVQAGGPTPIGSEAFALSAGGVRLPTRVEPVLGDQLVVGLVVDGSRRGAATLHSGVSGPANFLLQLPVSARVAAVADTKPPAVVAPLAVGAKEALGALDALRPHGERDTSRALTVALRQLPEASGEPRVLLLFTGAADAGGELATALAQRLNQAHTLLAVVSTAADNAYWSEVAAATGGVLVAPRGGDLINAFERLLGPLLSRYLLTFPAPDVLPAWVTVRVTTAAGTTSADTLVAALPASSGRAGTEDGRAPELPMPALIAAVLILLLAGAVLRARSRARSRSSDREARADRRADQPARRSRLPARRTSAARGAAEPAPAVAPPAQREPDAGMAAPARRAPPTRGTPEPAGTAVDRGRDAAQHRPAGELAATLAADGMSDATRPLPPAQVAAAVGVGRAQGAEPSRTPATAAPPSAAAPLRAAGAAERGEGTGRPSPPAAPACRAAQATAERAGVAGAPPTQSAGRAARAAAERGEAAGAPPTASAGRVATTAAERGEEDGPIPPRAAGPVPARTASAGRVAGAAGEREQGAGVGSPQAGDGGYADLDAQVSAAAAAVDSGRLDRAWAVARLALAAPGRVDLLDRIMAARRGPAGAQRGSAAADTALDLVESARRVIMGEATLTGPDGVRVEQTVPAGADRITRTLLRLTRSGRWECDCRTASELAQHIDISSLVASPSPPVRGNESEQ